MATIPLVGAAYLLGLQAPGLAAATARLLMSTPVETDGDVWADYAGDEATWVGYSPQVVGPWAAPSVSGTRALMSPAALPLFANGSGADVLPLGWALVAGDGSTLLAVGPLTGGPIPAGAQRYLTLALTDKGL